MVDIGDSGRQSDGSVHTNSQLGYAIANILLNIPKEEMLRDSNRILPTVTVGDDAFGLKAHKMKPYRNQNLPIDRRGFNYRLSRTRRIVEKAFGIAASRFRCIRRPLLANEKKVILITKTVVALHNFPTAKRSTKRGPFNYCPLGYTHYGGPSGFIAGQWRWDEDQINGIEKTHHIGSNNNSRDAIKVRQEFKSYSNAEGATEWRQEIVCRTYNPLDNDFAV